MDVHSGIETPANHLEAVFHREQTRSVGPFAVRFRETVERYNTSIFDAKPLTPLFDICVADVGGAGVTNGPRVGAFWFAFGQCPRWRRNTSKRHRQFAAVRTIANDRGRRA